MTKSKTETTTELKPANPANFKKAISKGKEMMKKGGVTKAEVARAVYGLVKDEERDVIVQVFIEGCGLTPKGAMTYVYNVRRQLAKSS